MSTFNTTTEFGKPASIDELTHKASEVLDDAKAAASKVVAQTKSEAKSLSDEAPKLLNLAAEALKAYTDKGASLAKDASVLARQKATEYADGAATRVRKDPLKAILVAAAAGAAVALIASYAAKNKSAK